MKNPALAVALLALFVALTGTGIAATGLITGAQIKDHTVGIVDLNATAVRLLHGQTGAAGAAGLPGLLSSSKLTYQKAQATMAAGGVANATAWCPAGQFIVSGGGYTDGQVMWESTPTAQGTVSGWAVGGTAYAAFGGTVTAIAVCAMP